MTQLALQPRVGNDPMSHDYQNWTEEGRCDKASGWARWNSLGCSTDLAILKQAVRSCSLCTELLGRHIEYVSPHFFAALTMTLYLIATTASLLLSTHVRVRIFGAVSVLAFAVAYIFYAQWFISVWCFFAALLSVLVCFQLVTPRISGNRRPLQHN